MGTRLLFFGALALSLPLAPSALAQVTLPQIVVSATTIPTSADQIAS